MTVWNPRRCSPGRTGHRDASWTRRARRPPGPRRPERRCACETATDPQTPVAHTRPRRGSATARSVDGDRLEALYALALTTGMRLGELLALRWANVDLPRRRGPVRGSLARGEEGLKVSETKTGRTRLVLLTTAASEALDRRRLVQSDERRRAREDWVELDFVFTNEFGRPLDPSNVRLRVRFRPALDVSASPAFGSTTSATPRPRSCSARASMPRWCQRCSATRRSGSRSTCIRTSPRACSRARTRQTPSAAPSRRPAPRGERADHAIIARSQQRAKGLHSDTFAHVR